MSIGRNDPCLCGSGKKYKKCCGKTEGAAIVQVLVEETSELQRELIDYAMENHSAMLKKEFQPLLQSNETLRQNEQVFLVTFEIWAILTRTIKENETILTKFVKKRVPSISRQRTAEIISSWLDYRFIAGVIEACDGPVYQVRDILTNETHSIRALRSVDLVGAFVTGALLPHEGDHTFFMTDFHFEAAHADAMTKAVQAKFEESPFDDSQAFYTQDFVGVMNTLFEVYEQDHSAVDLTTLTWEKDAHRETAEHIESSFQNEQLGQPVTQMAVLLWNYYCVKEDPAVRKPEVFTAALIGLLQTHGLVEQKESKAAIASRYAISASTLSKRQKEMEAVLEEKLQAAVNSQK